MSDENKGPTAPEYVASLIEKFIAYIEDTYNTPINKEHPVILYGIIFLLKYIPLVIIGIIVGIIGMIGMIGLIVFVLSYLTYHILRIILIFTWRYILIHIKNMLWITTAHS